MRSVNPAAGHYRHVHFNWQVAHPVDMFGVTEADCVTPVLVADNLPFDVTSLTIGPGDHEVWGAVAYAFPDASHEFAYQAYAWMDVYPACLTTTNWPYATVAFEEKIREKPAGVAVPTIFRRDLFKASTTLYLSGYFRRLRGHPGPNPSATGYFQARRYPG